LEILKLKFTHKYYYIKTNADVKLVMTHTHKTHLTNTYSTQPLHITIQLWKHHPGRNTVVHNPIVTCAFQCKNNFS